VAHKQEIILIAAIGRNRELGKDGDLLWRISDDLQRFKQVTSGYPIIMGRKTFESIGRPLPKRINIIVTRDTEYRQEGCVVVHTIEKALEAAKSTGAEKIFIIGGGEIYGAALPYADRLDLTLIEAEDKEADVFFPEFENQFREVSKEKPQEEGGVSYTWTQYQRKN
jgi:dihydrofolate reductase